MKTNWCRCGIVIAVASIFAAKPALLGAASGQVTLSSATPPTAEPGLTTVRLLGSGFPAGNFNPVNIQVLLAPQAGGASTTVPAVQYQTVAGTSSRVAFLLPASISVTTPSAFSVSISDPTDGFSSNNSVAVTVTPLASIASMTPDSGSLGQTVNVTVTGLYSHFLTGLTQVTAGDGLTIGSLSVTSATSLTVGLIIAASAPTGSQTITVSTGGEVESGPFTVQAPPVILPNVVGDTQAAATKAITNADLVVGTVTTKASSTVPPGDVISQTPVGGTSVSPGSAVNLVISGAATIQVPNVVGLPQAVASTDITNVGLVVGNIVYQTSATVPVDAIISQAPAAGASVAAGTAVNLVVSAQLLGPGLNEADSNIISVQNGTVGSTMLPAGQNEADSNLISVQNGTIGSAMLPLGQNEADSNLISASNEAASSAILKIRSSLALTENSIADGTGEVSLNGTELSRGETVTVTSDVPAQIWLNGERAGNDPNSATDLTFVAPEGADSLRIRPGNSAESSALVQQKTTVFTGRVVNTKGVGIANAKVHLRHSGLEAEFFELASNAPAEEVPSIAGLEAVNEEPVSSLNLHNPKQALSYFPIGAMDAPNFAVRFSGQFLAQTSGSYLFYVAATEGAQLSIDGKHLTDVYKVIPGLEAGTAVELAEGWHDISLLVYSKTGSAELVVTFTPPGGNRQIISSKLLRSESTTLSTLTGEDGEFTIRAPSWLDRVEAIATTLNAAGRQSGVSEAADKGVSNLGQVQLAPGKNF